jgi:transketolase
LVSNQTAISNLVPEARCRQHRLRLLEVSQRVSALHLAGSFSCLEILDTVYYDVMSDSDIFLLSKGHSGLAQYVVLESLGVLAPEHLDSYASVDALLGVHPTSDIPGIYFGTGSLGHGLNIALGAAVYKRNSGGRVFVVLSDGELQEGSTWEGIINAPALKLRNLTVIIDFNDYQSLGRTTETHPNLFPLLEKFQSFGWNTSEVDGHSNQEIKSALTADFGNDFPNMIIATTTKGKGVSFMENVPIWHYRSPSPDEYKIAVNEVTGGNL